MHYMKMSPKELADRLGSMRQLAGITQTVLQDGKARGVETLDFDNGSGLSFSVLAGRGMDIGQARFRGVPLAFLTPAGFCHPAYHEPEGFGWLRTWGAGLLTGCGMGNVGSPVSPMPNPVEGPLGLHGRLSNTPAEQVSVFTGWQDGRYLLKARGMMRESSLFGTNIEMTRELSTALGDNSITVADTVANAGSCPAPLMLLYHVNIGFPLLDDNAVIVAAEHDVRPRDAAAEKGLATWSQSRTPTAGYAEQCFYHDLPADSGGMAHIGLENRGLGLAMEVSFRKKELPFLTQWKMMGRSEYVMGLEPANCRPEGRVKERDLGTLRILQPGESIDTIVRIYVREI